jgi:predicted peptidase
MTPPLRHLTAALSSLMLITATAAATATDAQQPSSYEGQITLTVGYRYLLALPEGYNTAADSSWPLVIFLHGAGERGEDLNQIKRHGPPKLLDQGQTIPAIIASLQCEPGNTWDPHGVHALTQHLAKTHRVDPTRIYLTGLSMGGFGTWDTALAYPDTYAAIAPICGGSGIGFLKAQRLQHLPIWIFHGDADTVVPAEFSTRIFKALEPINPKAKLTLYPGVGHDSWTQTYEDPAFWQWLLDQKK